MGVRIQELPETTGINKEDVLIVEDGQGTKKGTVQQLDEALGVSQLKEDLVRFRDDFYKKISFDNRNLSSDNISTGSASRRWFTPKIESCDDVTFYFRGMPTIQNTGVMEVWAINGDSITKIKSHTFTIPKTSYDLEETSVKFKTPNCKNVMFSVRLDSVKESLFELKALSGSSYLYVNNITDNSFNISQLEVAFDYFIPYSYTEYVKNHPKNTVVVDASGCGDYTDIQTAIENVNDSKDNPITIYVRKGTYPKFSMVQNGADVNDITKNVSISSSRMRYISIIGDDVKNTVVYDGSGEYYTPPAEILTNGIIKNITFISDHKNPPSEVVRPWSYAVHIDFAPIGHANVYGHPLFDSDYVPQKVRFENCIFKSAQCSAVGMGLHKDELVEFIGCEFYSTTPTSGEYSQFLNYGAFLCHNYPHFNNVDGQQLVIDRCTFYSSNSPYAIYLTYANNTGETPFNFGMKVDARFNVAISENGNPFSKAPELSNVKGITTFGNNFEM